MLEEVTEFTPKEGHELAPEPDTAPEESNSLLTEGDDLLSRAEMDVSDLYLAIFFFFLMLHTLR